MATSFYSNAIHVDFDSVLAMDEPGMVSMFQALVASGLQGFLGCSAVVYEEALVEFFANGRVRDGLVVSSVDGVFVEISEKLFAETFELPVDGLGDLSEMPKDVIFDARSIVSLSGEPISLSGSKNQMKMPFRLLCDIVAKAISVKAGSFNAITVEKFSLLTEVVCRIKMNWAKFLFSVLKKMVTSGPSKPKGLPFRSVCCWRLFLLWSWVSPQSSQPPRSSLRRLCIALFPSMIEMVLKRLLGQQRKRLFRRRDLLLMLKQQYLRRRGLPRRNLFLLFLPWSWWRSQKRLYLFSR
ncbi:hypothetical protein F511_42616 [Dorcoceras hygrometricum]|uniref:Dystroglycan-like n=1 Tax=Dorcoceras hygrometricum TaxID=472368 RepID=A0A2Z7CKW4_9LAMI|nr:hypothetical protein F511_42616 [Dorcoceras hygrometricum]